MEKCATAFCPMVLALFLLTGAVSGTFAQETDFTLEEITVTAEKRAATIQDTAIAITAITGNDIVEESMITITDVLKNVPNITISTTGFGGSQIAIRGLGSDLPVGVGESSVSTNFDGTFNNRSESGMFGFFDLDRVEVLRGPQGTLYGRNATGGVVNVYSKNPNTEKIEGYAVFELGDYSLMREEGAINVPINEEIATRFAFSNINRDGYMSTGAGDKVGTAVRGKIGYYPSDDFTMVFSATGVDLGGISANTIVPIANWNAGDYYTTTETQPYDSYDRNNYKFNANIEIGMGPGTITFIPAYEITKERGWTYSAREDAMSGGNTDNTQKAAELRYSSGADAMIQWVTGLYYYDRSEESLGGTTNYPLPWSRGGESKAAFAQATYPFSDVFRVTAGARFSDEKVSLDNVNAGPQAVDVGDTYGGFDWKLGLESDLRDNMLGYVTLSTGRRPGGFNTDSGDIFEEEELLSAELGIKGRFMNNRLQLNGAVFWYDYDNYQVVDVYLDEDNDVVVNFFNVEQVKNYGAEIEAETLIGDSTLVNIAVSYLHARYDATYLLHEDPFSPPYDLDGTQLPHAPDWNIKGSIEHTFFLSGAGTLRPSASIRWSDAQYVAPWPGPNQTQDAYSIVDAYLRYGSPNGKLSLTLWAKNATDEVYKTGGVANGMIVGEPRMIGATFQIKY